MPPIHCLSPTTEFPNGSHLSVLNIHSLSTFIEHLTILAFKELTAKKNMRVISKSWEWQFWNQKFCIQMRRVSFKQSPWEAMH